MRTEIEKTYEYQAAARSDYWATLGYAYYCLGEPELAERIAAEQEATAAWLSQIGLLFERTGSGDCEGAEAGCDSILTDAHNALGVIARDMLAKCYYDKGQWDKTLEHMNELRSILSGGFVREAFYAKSLYWTGRAYESMGEKELALENYEGFLEIWKNADEDLPELIDAKNRLAGLKEKPVL
jgi:tetratricopeptide (TPR) repeat protein